MSSPKSKHPATKNRAVTKAPPSRDGQSIMRPWITFSVLSILVWIIYSNVLYSPFIFDDVANILNNPHIRLTQFTVDELTQAAFDSPSSNRPIANISFALNYYFHAYDTFGYHLVNILIHLITGLLLYLFVKTTLGLPSLHFGSDQQEWIPALTAAFWLVHPLHTQSVTYIVQRMNGMAAMFYILSFWLYTQARLTAVRKKRWALSVCSILAGLLALGSKEIAMTLPFFILLYEWYFFQELSPNWLKRHILLFAGILLFLAFAGVLFLGHGPAEKIMAAYETRNFTLSQRALTEFRVVIYYISLLFFPHPSRLNLDYDFALSHSLVQPITTMLSIAAIGALFGLALYTAKKARLLSFCILWFIGNLVIESSIIGLEIIFEHRTYLPAMLVVLMAVTLIFNHVRPKGLRLVVLTVVPILCAVWTYERNALWQDNVTLWSDCVEKSGKKARPHYNLGYALSRQGDLDDAISHYSMALRIDPDYADAHYNLANALAEKGIRSKAIAHYHEALRIKPDYEGAHNNLANIFVTQGRLQEAIRQFSQALRIKPDFPDAHYNLANALMDQGKTREAIAHYKKALKLMPNYEGAHNNLANALVSQGNLDEAIAHYRAALEIRPDFEEARNNLKQALMSRDGPEGAVSYYEATLRKQPNSAKAHHDLGNILARQGRLPEAINHFSQALRIAPEFAEAHTSLGNTLARQGDLKQAIYHYEMAVQLKPDFPEEHNNLGNALVRQGKLEDAIYHYREALRLEPDFPEAHYNLGGALAKQGKLQEAVSHFSQAIRIRPDYANAHNNLGSALARQGRLSEAVNHFSQALRIAPDFSGARQNLELVRKLLNTSKASNTAQKP